MARIRSLKPEFWRHPVLSRLPVGVHFLAAALPSMADNFGLFIADPREIRGQVMPRIDSLKKIQGMLDQLCLVDYVQVVKHPEQGLVGRITKWAVHQKIDHPGKTQLGNYFWARESTPVPASVASFSRIPRDSYRPAPEDFALDQGSGIRDQGKEQGGEGITVTPPSSFVFPTEEEMKSAAAAYPGSLARGTPAMIPVKFALKLLEWGRRHPDRWPGDRWQSWLAEKWEQELQDKGLPRSEKNAPQDFEKCRAPGDSEAWWTDPVEMVAGRVVGAEMRGDMATAARLKVIVNIREGKGSI